MICLLSPNDRTPEDKATQLVLTISEAAKACSPMTGFLASEFTSATGLNTQLIPANRISRPVAAETRSVISTEDVDARAIAPGLQRSD